MATTLTSTEAARSFSDLLNRVYYRKEEFVIERGGEKICKVVPATPVREFTGADFRALMKSMPALDDDFASDVEEGVRQQPLTENNDPWS